MSNTFMSDLFDSDPNDRPEYIEDALRETKRRMLSDRSYEKLFDSIIRIREENRRSYIDMYEAMQDEIHE